MNFNTSHVEVYLEPQIETQDAIKYFNTSHVEVYRKCVHRWVLVCSISIHLMLKFIETTATETIDISTFQYISC